MTHQNDDTTGMLNSLRSGNQCARTDLIHHAQKRIRHLAALMLRGWPGVRRWEDRDDVAQLASIQFERCLGAITPVSSIHFWRLAAFQIRRVLLSLARQHMGPYGMGTKHHTDGAGKAADDPGGRLHVSIDNRCEPDEDWTRFHQEVEALPDELRDVVELIFYADMKQEEVANELGISLRTVKRRWLEAKLLLSKRLGK